MLCIEEMRNRIVYNPEINCCYYYWSWSWVLGAALPGCALSNEKLTIEKYICNLR